MAGSGCVQHASGLRGGGTLYVLNTMQQPRWMERRVVGSRLRRNATRKLVEHHSGVCCVPRAGTRAPVRGA